MAVEDAVLKLEEAFENYLYVPTTNKRELMFDFYLLSALPQPDDQDLSIALKESREKLYLFLKDHMLEVVLFALCAEFRHVFDDNDSRAIRDFFDVIGQLEFIKKYAIYYKMSDTSFADYLDEVELKNRFKEDTNGYRRSYKAMWATGISEEEFAKLTQDAFIKLRWKASYGGQPWSDIAAGWLRLFHTPSDDIKELSISIDHIYDLQHNTNTVFNKVKAYYDNEKSYNWIKEALDFKYHIKSLYELFSKVSPDLKAFSAAVIKNANNTTWEEWAKAEGKWDVSPKPGIAPSKKPKEGDGTYATEEVTSKGGFQVGDKVKIIDDGKVYLGPEGATRMGATKAKNLNGVDSTGKEGIIKKVVVETDDVTVALVDVGEYEVKIDIKGLKKIISGPEHEEGASAGIGVGDKVEIINSGKVMSSANIIAKKLKLQNWQEGYGKASGQLHDGDIGIVTKLSTTAELRTPIAVVTLDKDGMEVIMNPKGLKVLVPSKQFDKSEEIHEPHTIHDFKVGDTVELVTTKSALWIENINKWVSTSNYNVGDIGIVLDIKDGKLRLSNTWYNPAAFKVHLNKSIEKDKTKGDLEPLTTTEGLKVGDELICLDDYSYKDYLKIGKKYTITEITGHGTVKVKNAAGEGYSILFSIARFALAD